MAGRDRIRLSKNMVDGMRVSERIVDGKLSTGRYGPVKEGRPLPEGAELLSVGEPDQDGWRDVTVLYRHERDDSGEDVEVAVSPDRSGPAQVATPAYRAGYDRIFGKTRVGQA